MDNTLKVWDLSDGRVLAGFDCEGVLLACAITSDRQTIVAGDAGGGVHFLRLEGVT
jgi:WD40 repeat protein